MTQHDTGWVQMDDSSLASFLGIEQRVTERGAHCRFTIDRKHMNPNEALHGGAMFTMLDLVMGIATAAQLDADQMCATSEIHIRYLKPIFEGVVEATATVLSRGRRIIHLDARAIDEAGVLVASATGSFVVLERPGGDSTSA